MTIDASDATDALPPPSPPERRRTVTVIKEVPIVLHDDPRTYYLLSYEPGGIRTARVTRENERGQQEDVWLLAEDLGDDDLAALEDLTARLFAVAAAKAGWPT